jgi:hypothetical protein
MKDIVGNTNNAQKLAILQASFSVKAMKEEDMTKT